MQPIQTDTSNVTLTLEGANDLPAERVTLYADDVDKDGTDGFETVWVPDEGEQKALANGAPVIMHLWGAAHPPVSLIVGEPREEARQLFDEPRLLRALSQLMMYEHDGGLPFDDPIAMRQRVQDAIAATADEEAFAQRLEAFKTKMAEEQDGTDEEG